ncbi:50S ribosomal protein L17 [Venenivibrio stagnispumantis]|uniref:Large ribosomal subunit protein bL17 n=1 Tax=Venenivibrio stagnispumantis TaxID=407998 RepID=A0AA45WLH3_9AQUI|nr:50S ribosomal protein L17 [Venenivibrio stagnispumantis]MCW4573288.1 50S ribosomal protein L17 [Venenivibrio stagnispumantis]SMP11275.1 large subunit ribosomal protein L17 [Venenivibrio stagnispumantis]
MRHRVKTKSFHRRKEQREALFVNLAKAMIEHGRITTTVEKAKALRPFVEKLVTLAKKQTIASRRLLNARLKDEKAATKLFKDIAPLFANRNGGYTRIYKLATKRVGDGGEKAIIEFVEFPEK